MKYKKKRCIFIPPHNVYIANSHEITVNYFFKSVRRVTPVQKTLRLIFRFDLIMAKTLSFNYVFQAVKCDKGALRYFLYHNLTIHTSQC